MRCRRMVLVVSAFSSVVLTIGCDPMVRRAVRLTPFSGGVNSHAHPPTADSALAAVERIASQFDLRAEPTDSTRCTRRWGTTTVTSPPPRSFYLTVCAKLAERSSLEVVVTERFTRHFSPTADSLARALNDTLGRFGTVRKP